MSNRIVKFIESNSLNIYVYIYVYILLLSNKHWNRYLLSVD